MSAEGQALLQLADEIEGLVMGVRSDTQEILRRLDNQQDQLDAIQQLITSQALLGVLDTILSAVGAVAVSVAALGGVVGGLPIALAALGVSVGSSLAIAQVLNDKANQILGELQTLKTITSETRQTTNENYEQLVRVLGSLDVANRSLNNIDLRTVLLVDAAVIIQTELGAVKGLVGRSLNILESLQSELENAIAAAKDEVKGHITTALIAQAALITGEFVALGAYVTGLLATQTTVLTGAITALGGTLTAEIIAQSGVLRGQIVASEGAIVRNVDDAERRIIDELRRLLGNPAKPVSLQEVLDRLESLSAQVGLTLSSILTSQNGLSAEIKGVSSQVREVYFQLVDALARLADILNSLPTIETVEVERVLGCNPDGTPLLEPANLPVLVAGGITTGPAWAALFQAIASVQSEACQQIWDVEQTIFDALPYPGGDLDLPARTVQLRFEAISFEEWFGRRFGADANSDSDDKFSFGHYAIGGANGFQAEIPIQWINQQSQWSPFDTAVEFPTKLRVYVQFGAVIRVTAVHQVPVQE